MSPRAALRLERLGFTRVYDYVPGKSDWIAAGLPREGRSAGIPNAGDVAHSDVPTCRVGDGLRAAIEGMDEEGHSFCVAVADDRVVLGMLYRGEAEGGGTEATVEDAMRPGPTTIRALEPLEPLAARMREGNVDGILVTDPEGRLLGLLDRQDAERVLQHRSG